MADFGYEVADYCGVDSRFGALADFDDLLAQAHARGLKMLLDFVPNHTSDRHPWFVESRSSRDNPKREVDLPVRVSFAERFCLFDGGTVFARSAANFRVVFGYRRTIKQALPAFRALAHPATIIGHSRNPLNCDV
jgi:hypothetical protein